MQPPKMSCAVKPAASPLAPEPLDRPQSTDDASAAQAPTGPLLRKWLFLGAIIEDGSLPPSAFRVAYALLDHFNNETGQCNPSLETLSERLGITTRGVQKGIVALVTGHWFQVRVGHGPGNSNKYAPVWAAALSPAPAEARDRPPRRGEIANAASSLMASGTSSLSDEMTNAAAGNDERRHQEMMNGRSSEPGNESESSTSSLRGRARKLADQILEIVKPPPKATRWHHLPDWVETWLRQGLDPERDILVAARTIMVERNGIAPDGPKYLQVVAARMHSERLSNEQAGSTTNVKAFPHRRYQPNAAELRRSWRADIADVFCEDVHRRRGKDSVGDGQEARTGDSRGEEIADPRRAGADGG